MEPVLAVPASAIPPQDRHGATARHPRLGPVLSLARASAAALAQPGRSTLGADPLDRGARPRRGHETSAWTSWALPAGPWSWPVEPAARPRESARSGSPVACGDAVNKRPRWQIVRALARRGGTLCSICCYPMKMNSDPRKHPDAATIDHRVPKSRGGTNHFDNLQLAHSRCNLQRGDDPWSGWPEAP